MLFRLSQSEHRDDLVLKGAMLFVLWSGSPHRATRDVDFLGFGDPSVERVESLLRDLCELSVDDDGLTFDPETVVAEKLEAMVNLGMATSRMKDFYDIWFLSRQFEFEGGVLGEAIKATFARRGTDLPRELPTALSPTFAQDDTKRTQWRAFLSKTGIVENVALEKVVDALWIFVGSILESLVADEGLRARAPTGSSTGGHSARQRAGNLTRG